MVYSLEELKSKIKPVAEQHDIHEIRLFGSYYDGKATEQSDIDVVVSYGPDCRGLKRISFMMALEETLGKEVDVINIKFKPEFMDEMDIDNERRVVYARQMESKFKIAY